MKKSNARGITIISLIIIIVVILLIAGVSINAIIGENGIITKYRQEKQMSEEQRIKEEVELMLTDAKFETNDNVTMLETYLDKKIREGTITSKTNNGDGTITIEKEGKRIRINTSTFAIELEKELEKELVLEELTSAEATAQGFTWNVLENNTIELTEYTGKATNLTIPNKIDGKIVTTIGTNTFFINKTNNNTIKSITIPANIINMGNDEKEIKCVSFYRITNLETVNVDVNNLNYSSEDGVVYNKDKTKLIYIPSKKTGSFIMPNTIETFSICEVGGNSLTEITIPANLTKVNIVAEKYNEKSLFAEMENLEIINVDEKNPNYSSEYGSLYNKDKTKILDVPAKKTSLIMPNTVESFEVENFEGYYLTTITIPERLRNIDNLFLYAMNLKTINVDANNPNYSSEDGIVYNKEKTKLIVVPIAKTGSITISASVEEIYRDYTNNLQEINVDANNQNYSSIDGVVYNKNKTRLIQIPKAKTGSLIIPNTVTTIEEDAFNKTNLSEITVEQGNSNYSSIDGVLYNKEKTKLILVPSAKTGSITIPASVVEISEYLTNNNLQAINVEAGNQNYSSVDGALYNKDKTILIKIPKAKTGSFTIHNTVDSVGSSEFDNITLTEIIFPENVMSVKAMSFDENSTVQSIKIKNTNVADIENYNFYIYGNEIIYVKNEDIRNALIAKGISADKISTDYNWE